MAVHDIANAATALYDVAKRVFDSTSTGGSVSSGDVRSAYRAGKKLVGGINDTFTNSLTKYTDATTIRSRVFIDGTIAQEPVIKDMLPALHWAYVAMINTALHLQKMIVKGQSVRTMLNVVRTSVDVEEFVDLESILDDQIAAFEVIALNPTSGMKGYSSSTGGFPGSNKKSDTTKKLSTAGLKAEELSNVDLKPADPSIPIGQMIPVTFANPDNPSVTATIMVNVVMTPAIMSPALAVKFITRNVTASFAQRYLMWRVGELSFWRDLIARVDVIEDQIHTAKADKTGTFALFLAETAKKDRDTLANVINQAGGIDGWAHAAAAGNMASKNIANTVMIFSEDTVRAAKAETGFDMHKDSDRARYFSETYTMIIAIVDPYHHIVTLYMNGVPGKSENSYDSFKKKKHDDNDLKALVALLTAGRPIKF